MSQPRGERGDDQDRDAGSVVAEWAMVAGVTAVLFAVTLQVIFALHVRNVLIDAASHGARYGTLADRGPGDAVERTNQLITQTVGARFAGNVSANPATVNGVPTLEITVVAPLPIVGPFGPAGTLEVTGHAVETS
ncbi:TadE family protein [Kocuria sp.]|uniref:TadE family protein n=1 Tax=Kocuria sp. TaxID=1871328 RepID=UPI0026DFBC17|nr:TadE family protein [Kocuria sp.]MDO5619607.1 pilus assembly protein [Kocuria sp.]